MKRTHELQNGHHFQPLAHLNKKISKKNPREDNSITFSKRLNC